MSDLDDFLSSMDEFDDMETLFTELMRLKEALPEDITDIDLAYTEEDAEYVMEKLKLFCVLILQYLALDRARNSAQAHLTFFQTMGGIAENSDKTLLEIEQYMEEQSGYLAQQIKTLDSTIAVSSRYLEEEAAKVADFIESQY